MKTQNTEIPISKGNKESVFKNPPKEVGKNTPTGILKQAIGFKKLDKKIIENENNIKTIGKKEPIIYNFYLPKKEDVKDLKTNFSTKPKQVSKMSLEGNQNLKEKELKKPSFKDFKFSPFSNEKKLLTTLNGIEKNTGKTSNLIDEREKKEEKKDLEKAKKERKEELDKNKTPEKVETNDVEKTNLLELQKQIKDELLTFNKDLLTKESEKTSEKNFRESAEHNDFVKNNKNLALVNKMGASKFLKTKALSFFSDKFKKDLDLIYEEEKENAAKNFTNEKISNLQVKAENSTKTKQLAEYSKAKKEKDVELNEKLNDLEKKKNEKLKNVSDEKERKEIETDFLKQQQEIHSDYKNFFNDLSEKFSKEIEDIKKEIETSVFLEENKKEIEKSKNLAQKETLIEPIKEVGKETLNGVKDEQTFEPAKKEIENEPIKEVGKETFQDDLKQELKKNFEEQKNTNTFLVNHFKTSSEQEKKSLLFLQSIDKKNEKLIAGNKESLKIQNKAIREDKRIVDSIRHIHIEGGDDSSLPGKKTLRKVFKYGKKAVNFGKKIISGGSKLFRGASIATEGAEAVEGASVVAEGAAGAGAVAEGGGAIAALASNPVGWAIAGTIAVGAAAYGIYHLSIDDDSEAIMDQLEKSGAVEHNFFGNSEIKKWKQIYVLKKKQIDALKRFDDWSKGTKRTLEALEKIDSGTRKFFGLLIGDAFSATKDGVLSIDNFETFQKTFLPAFKEKVKKKYIKFYPQFKTILSESFYKQIKKIFDTIGKTAEVVKKPNDKTAEKLDKKDNKDNKDNKENKTKSSKENKVDTKNKSTKDNTAEKINSKDSKTNSPKVLKAGQQVIIKDGKIYPYNKAQKDSTKENIKTLKTGEKVIIKDGKIYPYNGKENEKVVSKFKTSLEKLGNKKLLKEDNKDKIKDGILEKTDKNAKKEGVVKSSLIEGKKSHFIKKLKEDKGVSSKALNNSLDKNKESVTLLKGKVKETLNKTEKEKEEKGKGGSAISSSNSSSNTTIINNYNESLFSDGKTLAKVFKF